jgi:hypothetical protein
MEFSVAGQSLNGGDFGSVGLHGQDRAGFNGFSVEENRARSAEGRFTADVGAGELALVPQEMNQKSAGLYFVLLNNSVNL